MRNIKIGSKIAVIIILWSAAILVLPPRVEGVEYKAKGIFSFDFVGGGIGLPLFWEYHILSGGIGYKPLCFSSMIWRHKTFYFKEISDYLLTDTYSGEIYITLRKAELKEFFPIYIYLVPYMILDYNYHKKYVPFLVYLYGGTNIFGEAIIHYQFHNPSSGWYSDPHLGYPEKIKYWDFGIGCGISIFHVKAGYFCGDFGKMSPYWSGYPSGNYYYQPPSFATYYISVEGQIGGWYSWYVEEIYPPSLYANSNFSDVNGNGNGILESGEEGEVVLRVSNDSKGDAGNVKLALSISDYEFRDRVKLPNSVSIGKIKAGVSKTITIPIKAKENLPTGNFKITCTSTSHKEGEYFETETWITTKQLVPPYLAFDVTPFDDNQDRTFDAGEVVGFKLNIKNSGRGEAYKVNAFVKNNKGEILDKKSLGSIKPAEKRDVELRFQMPLNTKKGMQEFNVGLTEVSGYAPEPKIIRVETSELASVVFNIEAEIDDDKESPSQGNSDGMIDKGETIELKLHIKNDGAGTARGVKISGACNKTGVDFTTAKTEIGNIESGGRGEGTLLFSVKDITGNDIPINLTITEATGKFTRTKTLSYKLGEPTEIVVGPTAKFPKRENTYALVIGISKYEDKSLSKLEYAERDAKAMARLLEANGIANVDTLVGDKARGKNIRVELSKLKGMADKDSYIYIFFSGHGASRLLYEKDTIPSGIAPYDIDMQNPNTIEASYISRQELEEFCKSVDAKGIFIAINACYSGPAGAAPTGIEEPPLELPPGKVMFFASQSLAWEVPEYRHSIFAYRLIEALKGANNVNNDEWIDVDEAWQWIEKYIPDDAKNLKGGAKQAPVRSGKSNFGVVRCSINR